DCHMFSDGLDSHNLMALELYAMMYFPETARRDGNCRHPRVGRPSVCFVIPGLLLNFARIPMLAHRASRCEKTYAFQSDYAHESLTNRSERRCAGKLAIAGRQPLRYFTITWRGALSASRITKACVIF